ncbi:WD repeat-containing and planar cell polarity effector protein fritz [Teleopsis dalmanni]|uniref:WD repeat-containing and planar cell polarity effector protein fritz n=1 Tax=Teleopsis dalmanni TaxID=139649 RepID=UPI0018CD5FCE|nr:WD repeat-containing and planar cell polarity effector protein fritz [Teleopsis dalmanni]
MLTLLSECHFWTLRDEVRIKPTDYGAFRYMTSREFQQSGAHDLAAIAKRDYTERRNGIAVLKNNRKSNGRLKDNIKKLCEMLRSQRIVYSQWKDAAQVLLLFANGLIAHICVDIYTGDILRMVFEKYFVGKLAAEVITDAFFTRSHIVLAYNTNQLTVVYLQKPNMRPQGPEKISNMDPRIFHVIIPGPGERKLSRHLSVNSSYDLFVIWTKSSQNEVYPWRPTIRDQDRANIHVFKLKDAQLESISYCWSENDPLCVDFLRSSESQILTVEQKVSRKGEIFAEICSYEITPGKMQRTALTSITMGTEICCFAFSPDQEKLFLGTIDRNICLHDLVLQSTKYVAQIEIIPTQCTWHSDSSIIMTANDRAQFQCFDLALTPIGNQLQSEDVTPSNLLDLSHYFTVQPTLLEISFSPKPDLANFTHTFAQTDCFLLFTFDNGPIGCLRFFSGAGMRGDIHNSGLTADVIVDKYLALNQLEKAVNLLVALNWETYGAMCLISLHKISNYVFYRSDVKRARIELLAKALKTFSDTLSEETKDEFSDQVFDLKRRFFFYLLRQNLFTDAFEVAQDIDDYDLFMDLFNITKQNTNMSEFSATCLTQAAVILHEEDRANGNLSMMGDSRSESACSLSTVSDIPTTINHSNRTLQTPHAHNQQSSALQNYVPPLPSLKSKVFSAEMIKINIPKPELRIDTTQERTRPPPPPLPNIKQLKIKSASHMSTDASALATLAMKSGSNINTQQTKTMQTNGSSLSLLNNEWQQLTDVGIPISIATATATNLCIPATITANKPLRVPTVVNTQEQANSYLHYASTSNPERNPVPTFTLYQQHQQQQQQHQHQQQQQQQQLQQQQIPMLSGLPTATYQPKFYQHPLVSGTIPPTITVAHDEQQKRLLTRKPTASILSNSSVALNGSNAINTAIASNNVAVHNGSATLKDVSKNVAGEKNKVKFSDTVQVAVVPEIPRKEKPLPPKRNGYSRPLSRNLTNPKKELADSLPLCHPNDDYLKDFNPISTEDAPRIVAKQHSKEDQTATKSPPPAPPPAIKVVHFGVV